MSVLFLLKGGNVVLYSVDYRSSKKEEADEIRCPYNQLGLLYPYIKEHPEKRINIVLKEQMTAEEVEKAKEQVDLVKMITENYTVQCFTIEQLMHFIENKYAAYQKFPVVDWETYQCLREWEVSDIYIDGCLAFQMPKILASKGNTKIRISPSSSPNAVFYKTKTPNFFFVRPEDLHLYDSYVDIIDFNTVDTDMEDTLFDIYKRGNFSYPIQKLIQQLDTPINNAVIKEVFAETRLNCGQRCKIPQYSCHYCETYFTFIDTTWSLLTK